MARRRYDPSRDRLKLDRLLREFSKTIQFFCGDEPLIKGSFHTLSRRCGKSGCRCTRGQLHESLVFSDRSSGERRIRKASGRERQILGKPASRYRSLRKLRARLSGLHREALECCDRLSEHRLSEGQKLLERARRGRVS